MLVGALLVFNLINPMPLTSLLPAGFMAVLLLYFQVLGRKAWAKRAFSDLGGGVSKFRFDDYGLSVESSLRQQSAGMGVFGAPARDARKLRRLQHTANAVRDSEARVQSRPDRRASSAAAVTQRAASRARPGWFAQTRSGIS